MNGPPLRIVHLLSHDRLTSGGAIQAVLLARAQRRHGYDVRLAYNTGRSGAAAAAEFATLETEGFPCQGFPMQHLARRAGRRRFAVWLHATAPDVVHVHRERALRFALAALARMPFPALVAQKGNCYRSDWRTARAFRAGRLDRIIAVAGAVKRVLVLHDRVPPEKVEVVYGSFDPLRFGTPPDREAARAALGITPATPVVGILANLDKKKGHGQFFAAARRIRARRPDALFLVVGGGDLEAARALAAAHEVAAATRFTGFRADAERVLAAFDVSVNCSRDGEGLTGAVRESLALGVPVVCTNVAGNPEIVETGRTGLVVAADDVDGLAAAVLHVLEHPAEARRLGNAGRRQVLEQMDNEERARRVEGIYRDVLAWRRPALAHAGLERCLRPDVRLFDAEA